ncbi:thyroid hormone receptor interactor 10b isoform X2 [Triplophysa dalaica]|uniref:thyroid hormone receptor interactor 10b isoform X2 n=1 Tax=Triplophysa dalaica TaxID=1582913 RepID=UPI0024DFD3F7|nr:thyroid hormone receptor interactor 10b isoform X2 [Triplophysa dalaica]
MDWGFDLWDQQDVIERHTQCGLEQLERYVKFVKERAEIEQNYAKQLRNLSKKYSRRGIKEDHEMKLTNQQAFQEVLNELNDYAAQREQLSEIMTVTICVDLTKNIHELRQERKNYFLEIKKCQQNLEGTLKQLDLTKKRFEKEWREAEKAIQQTERIQQEPNITKADVDKAKQQENSRTHVAEACKKDYAVQHQKYNNEQNNFYRSEIPSLLKNLQNMEERRIRMLADGYMQFSETEKNLLPNIIKCLDAISTAGRNINEKQDTAALIDQYKSGAAPPADVEFEDYSQSLKTTGNENTPQLHKARIKLLFHKKSKITSPDKNMPPSVEDFTHLPLDQRKKRLQDKIDNINRELQKEMEQSEAMNKMKGVYEQNSKLGDPSSLEPQITQTIQNIAGLKEKLRKYQAQLNEAGGVSGSHNNSSSSMSPSDENIYEFGFDEDFVDVPIGQCKALYNYDGDNEGAVCIRKDEQLTLMVEDQGDGWVRVQRANGDTGYVPASYIQTI